VPVPRSQVSPPCAHFAVFWISLALLVTPSAGWALDSIGIDLSNAVVLTDPADSLPEVSALQMLVDEAAKRDGSAWKVMREGIEDSARCTPCILIERHDQLERSTFYKSLHLIDGPPSHAESFRIDVVHSRAGAVVLIDGSDDRGVLYGVGYLLRHLDFARGRAAFQGPMHVATAPEFAIRGHQLGYRFKNNTYDAWTPERFEQYIRDLAVFGTNTIEILPPITDDARSSPLFPLPAMEMMIRLSALVQKYGLRCSVYYPAMAKDYANSATVDSELHEWGSIFRQLPQIDDLFVPGGDPGHTDPAVLFPFLAKVAVVLHRFHPNAGVWVSAQGFNADQMRRFYSLVNARPAWLTGVVVGPQSRDDLIIQRANIDTDIPIRFYPDIAHSMHSQFPVPEWDEALALTEGREVVNPRPAAESEIFRHYARYMNGFVTYSEGVNDDVNKFVWSALGWSAATDSAETLRQYARYFVGSSGFPSGAFARAVGDLEMNWKGPLRSNLHVQDTAREFQAMEKTANQDQARNWRFEAALYRALTDAYEQKRLAIEDAQEQTALRILARAEKVGSFAAMQQAEKALMPSAAETGQLRPLRGRIETLAGELFSDIGIQLSMKYGASAIDRGASLDTLDVDLNDRAWLNNQFVEIRRMPSEIERQRAIAAVTHWGDAGPDGFYDNLGDPLDEQHLVRGPGYPTDPAFFHTAHDGIADRTPNEGWKLSQISYAGAFYDHPLELYYTGLNPAETYKLRVVYAGEDYTLPVSLVADDRLLIHGPRLRKSNPEMIEFDVPRDATRGGTLDLKWTRPAGIGGGGRGLQVAEVWLMPTRCNR